MYYYGLGADSKKEDQTRYQLNTASIDARAGYRFTRSLNAGIDVSYGGIHTGATSGGDIPSIEMKFDRTTAPGLFDDTTFASWGAFAGFDTRDVVRRPRAGGFYGAEFRRYLDLDAGTYTHRQPSPRGSSSSRISISSASSPCSQGAGSHSGHNDRHRPVLSVAAARGQLRPARLQPYGSTDNNGFMAALEHRWYVFSGLGGGRSWMPGRQCRIRGHVDSRTELQRRPRDALRSPRRGRDADGRRQEPRGCPVDLVAERHLAEELQCRPAVLVVPRQTARARTLVLAIASARPAAAQKFLSRRPALRANCHDAGARSGAPQSERASRGDVTTLAAGRTAAWQGRDREAQASTRSAVLDGPGMREPSRTHAHEPGSRARQRDEEPRPPTVHGTSSGRNQGWPALAFRDEKNRVYLLRLDPRGSPEWRPALK